MLPDERKCGSLSFSWPPRPHYSNKQLEHLAKHFEIVGGFRDAILASEHLSEELSNYVGSLKNILQSKVGEGKLPLSTCPE